MRAPLLVACAAVLTVSIAAPARAQLLDARVGAARTQARADTVVARLMSFDRDGDGLVTRAELPERMYGLLENSWNAAGLEARDVLRIAQQLRLSQDLPGFEPGHYGFGGDNGFDTRLHIEGAIEDLRLADARRGQAIVVARRFLDTETAEAKRQLLAAAKASLNAEQLAAFTATLDQPMLDGVLSVVVREGGPTVKAMVARSQAFRRQAALAALVNQFPLTLTAKRQLADALDRFKPHDELSGAERARLLNQMRTLLTAQERDDLRAALERRPIVKQTAGVTVASVSGFGVGFVAVQR
jgi:hypothetical protein